MVRQRTIATLGRLERIALEVESIVRGLRRAVSGEQELEAIGPSLVEFAPSRTLGDVWTLDAPWKGRDRHRRFPPGAVRAPSESLPR